MNKRDQQRIAGVLVTAGEASLAQKVIGLSNKTVIEKFLEGGTGSSAHLKSKKIGNYMVLIDYKTPIAALRGQEGLYINTNKYSATTSRSQRELMYLAEKRGEKIHEVDETKLRTIIKLPESVRI
jgi:hypothetical protein